jgi:hypothetical protein
VALRIRAAIWLKSSRAVPRARFNIVSSFCREVFVVFAGPFVFVFLFFFGMAVGCHACGKDSIGQKFKVAHYPWRRGIDSLDAFFGNNANPPDPTITNREERYMFSLQTCNSNL